MIDVNFGSIWIGCGINVVVYKCLVKGCLDIIGVVLCIGGIGNNWLGYVVIGVVFLVLNSFGIFGKY